MMDSALQNRISSTEPRRCVDLQPNLPGAFLGLWRITWRSRMTWRHFARLGCFLLAVPVLILLTVEPFEQDDYAAWAIGFYQTLMLPLGCLAMFGPLIRDELQADTMGFLLTRPVTRARIFLLKYVCLALWSQMIFGLGGLFVLGAGWIKRVDGVGQMALWFLLAQALAVFAFGALAALLGLLSKRYMVLGVVYGFIVEWGVGSIPTNINSLSMGHHVRTLMGNSRLIEKTFEWSPDGTMGALLIMPAAIAGALIAGALLFTFREYHHSDEMQK